MPGPRWQDEPPAQAPGVEAQERPGGTLLLRRGDRLFALSAPGRAVWTRLDGRTPLRELVRAHALEAGVVAPHAVVALLDGLWEAGLLSVEPPPAERPVGLARWALASERPWRWAGGARVVAALHARAGKWLCSRELVGLLVGLGLLGLPALGRVPPSGPGAAGLGLLAVLALVEVGVHELAHGLALHHHGARVRAVGLRWHWFGPMAFVDTTEAWALPRRARVAVSLAGPLVNLGLGGLAALVALGLPGELGAVAWAAALGSYAAAVFNLDPFLELDGYYVLVDVLERPGLRERAVGWLAEGRPATPLERAFAVACCVHALAVGPVVLVLWHGWVAEGLGGLLGDGADGAGVVVAAAVAGLVVGQLGLELRAVRSPELRRERERQRREG